jgi:hypothetical protein
VSPDILEFIVSADWKADAVDSCGNFSSALPLAAATPSPIGWIGCGGVEKQRFESASAKKQRNKQGEAASPGIHTVSHHTGPAASAAHSSAKEAGRVDRTAAVAHEGGVTGAEQVEQRVLRRRGAIGEGVVRIQLRKVWQSRPAGSQVGHCACRAAPHLRVPAECSVVTGAGEDNGIDHNKN